MTPVYKMHEQLELDTDLISWCEKAVVETFSSMLGITPTLESAIHNPPDRLSHEISGVIGFIQNRMEGTLALGFTYDMSIKLMSEFFKENLKVSDPNLVGGISELTNIIFGMIKENYSNSGLTFKMCLPVVIVGSNHTCLLYTSPSPRDS